MKAAVPGDVVAEADWRSELRPVERVSVEALDEIMGQPYEVGSDGFLRVVDYMGGEASIVQAARVSYGAGTKTVHDDRGLLRYLLRHRHTTPFEMARIKLHVRVPMDTWRQWIRHRTAGVNEYSTRYSVAIDSMEMTKPDEWRMQAAGNRQGSDGYLDSVGVGAVLSEHEAQMHVTARRIYKERLDCGVAREQARKDLPLSTYTEAYWTIDLHNLLGFLSLRMDSHAQQEIREYAEVIGRLVALWVPEVWSAFLDYRLGAMQLSRREVKILSSIMREDTEGIRPTGLPKREMKEFEAKLQRMGVAVPWK